MRKTLIKLFQAPIRLYTLLISPFLGPNCRFEPTCSSYALEALEKHGVIKGLFLAVTRLLKCHPWCKCARHDPVPKSFDWPIDRRALISYKRSSTTLENKKDGSPT